MRWQKPGASDLAVDFVESDLNLVDEIMQRRGFHFFDLRRQYPGLDLIQDRYCRLMVGQRLEAAFDAAQVVPNRARKILTLE